MKRRVEQTKALHFLGFSMLTEVTASKLTCLIGKWCCIVGVLHWLQLRRFILEYKISFRRLGIQNPEGVEAAHSVPPACRRGVDWPPPNNLGTRTMVFSLTWEPEKIHQTQVQPTNFSLVKSCYPSIVSRPSRYPAQLTSFRFHQAPGVASTCRP